ncbi:hypothetical protein ABZV77_24130 [Streptomyces sp. NPDC004732]|uniref:hypothetical protein n=1 Tax=Streptomyces sp. NPDC004732 TaxID=3154290 RepID=UPI0033BCAA73
MPEMFLRRLSRWQAEQQREAVADLYVEAGRGTVGTAGVAGATGSGVANIGVASGSGTGESRYGLRQDFLRRFEHDVQQTDFDMVVADSGGLVGCLYGYRAERGGEWWESLRSVLSPDVEERTASGRVFLLRELMVVPAERGSGVAARLRTLLLTRHTSEVVVAVIDPDDVQGRKVLQSWDWTQLGGFTPRQEGWLRPPSPLP